MKSKKNVYIVITLLVCFEITFSLFIFISDSKTPLDYLKTEYDADYRKPTELLYQETLNNGIIIVFFINQYGAFDCTLMEENIIGYNILGYSGSIDINDADTYLYGSFKKGQNVIDICWGILTDNNISEVLLDNQNCVIVDTAYNEFRLFWLTGIWDNLPTLVKK